MRLFTSIHRHLHSRAFWTGFFSVFSFDITGRTQARMISNARGYGRVRTTREILEQTDEEAFADDRAALECDWAAIAKDFPPLR